MTMESHPHDNGPFSTLPQHQHHALTRQSPTHAARLLWIQRAYTVVAAFSFGWALNVILSIYTKVQFEIPVFGKMLFTEVVIYTLIADCILLPTLLALVIWYRATVDKAGLPPHLPAARFTQLAGPGMPSSFRMAAFVVLVGTSLFAAELAYQRFYNELNIIWKPHHWWQPQDPSLLGKKPTVLSREQMFSFPPKPEPDRGYSNWRFAKVPPEARPREPLPEDEDGRPESSKRREPVQISAAPGWLPWTFRIVIHTCIAVAAWLLVTHRRRMFSKRVLSFRS